MGSLLSNLISNDKGVSSNLAGNISEDPADVGSIADRVGALGQLLEDAVENVFVLVDRFEEGEGAPDDQLELSLIELALSGLLLRVEVPETDFSGVLEDERSLS